MGGACDVGGERRSDRCARGAITAIAFALALFGMQQMMRGPMGGAHTWAVWTALGVSLIGIAAAIRFRRGVLLGFGAAGVVLFSITGIMEFFAGQIAGPILHLVAGVVFIAMAVFVAVIWPRIRGGERRGTMHAV